MTIAYDFSTYEQFEDFIIPRPRMYQLGSKMADFAIESFTAVPGFMLKMEISQIKGGFTAILSPAAGRPAKESVKLNISRENLGFEGQNEKFANGKNEILLEYKIEGESIVVSIEGNTKKLLYPAPALPGKFHFHNPANRPQAVSKISRLTLSGPLDMEWVKRKLDGSP